jgi:hypothetical protein
MKIEWLIEYMQTTPVSSNPPLYVINCGWRCNGQDEKFSSTVYGTCSFQQKPEENGTYTPYEELTQEQVLNWCWESSVNKEATELSISTQIENQKNPPIITPPLPWKNK